MTFAFLLQEDAGQDVRQPQPLRFTNALLDQIVQRRIKQTLEAVINGMRKFTDLSLFHGRQNLFKIRMVSGGQPGGRQLAGMIEVGTAGIEKLENLIHNDAHRGGGLRCGQPIDQFAQRIRGLPDAGRGDFPLLKIQLFSSAQRRWNADQAEQLQGAQIR